MEREYDIIVWGASGFTGRLVVDYMASQAAASNLKWAVAGRNVTKVKQVLGDRDIPVVQADSHDDASIHALAQKARVILTTVGPYARYGSSLVAACAEHGTHYCDLTGEVHWMRDMITAHQETAKASGARIVHTCGFDSIPSDLGVYFLYVGEAWCARNANQIPTDGVQRWIQWRHHRQHDGDDGVSQGRQRHIQAFGRPLCAQ